MYVKGRASLAAAAAVTLAISGVAEAKKSEWTQVSLGPGGQGAWEVEVKAPQLGNPDATRTVRPSCSGGPLPGESLGSFVLAPTDYSFFVEKGNPNKILISLDGGGACWDAETCIGSPLFGSSTYSPAVDETVESLSQSQGVLDNENNANPFQNYTKVFIPYCTGDIHWGSKDTVYDLDGENGPFPPLPIYHRGTDNLLAALDWLQKNGLNLGAASDVTVAGVSAGGYGANLAFAYVAPLTNPEARINLISDSAVGVIDDPARYIPGAPSNTNPLEFYSEAIYNSDEPGSESWGVGPNLPPAVFGPYPRFLANSAGYPLQLLPSIMAALSNSRPDAKLAALTTNLDATQVAFYGLMNGAFPPGEQTFGEWYGAMSFMVPAPAEAGLPNYRFFIDDGLCHTFLFFDEEFYRQGANGTSVADWVRAMIKPGNRAWDNLGANLPPTGPFPECSFSR